MSPQGPWLLLVFVAIGGAFRTQPPEPPSPLIEVDNQRDHRSLVGPRNLTLFESDWLEMMEAEHRRSSVMTKKVRLILGVFTVGAEQQHREIVRRTWMNQTGVCDLLAGRRRGCSVYVAFVMGSRDQKIVNGRDKYKELTKHLKGDPNKEDRMLVLNASDFMDLGKSFEFFRLMAERYHWATHVGKCDIDAYPAIRKLVASIRENSLSVGTPYSYAGMGEACPLGGCGRGSMMNFTETPPYLCKEKNTCMAGDRMSLETWAFHLGALYLMSMPLVRAIAVRGGVWENPPQLTHEDVVAANAVHDFFNSTWTGLDSPCLHVWNPKAYCHRGVCKYARHFDDF